MLVYDVLHAELTQIDTVERITKLIAGQRKCKHKLFASLQVKNKQILQPPYDEGRAKVAFTIYYKFVISLMHINDINNVHS